MEKPILEEAHVAFDSKDPENPAQQPIEENHPYNEQGLSNMQECYEHDHVASETRCVYNPDERQLYEEPSAVDLRTTKPVEESPGNDAKLNTTKRQFISEAQLVENLFFNYPCPNNSSAKLFFIDNNQSLKANCVISNNNVQLENCDSGDVTDFSIHKNDTEIGYSYKTIESNNQDLSNSSTNTDPVILVNQECQTSEMERKDASVQTGPVLPYSMYRYLKEPDLKFKCSICRRTYNTKNNFHRHLRTHVNSKNKECKLLTNVRFTTEAKLQIYKKHITHERPPVILQVPEFTYFECNICEKIFQTESEKNGHKCLSKPFPMTKCLECDVKFYTTGGLNDHVNFVHKKENTENNTYYCIFCNQSFAAGYSFHLHLDTHLSL